MTTRTVEGTKLARAYLEAIRERLYHLAWAIPGEGTLTQEARAIMQLAVEARDALAALDALRDGE